MREPFLVVCRLKISTGLWKPCPLVSGGLSATPDKPKLCARWLLPIIDTLVPVVLAPVYSALCSDRAYRAESISWCVRAQACCFPAVRDLPFLYFATERILVWLM